MVQAAVLVDDAQWEDLILVAVAVLDNIKKVEELEDEGEYNEIYEIN